MKVTGEVNTAKWAFDPLEPGPVVAPRPNRYNEITNYVPPAPTAIIPSRHEVIDPYAHAPALQQAQVISHHNATPESRARAMLIKATAVTIALAILTGAAMIVLVDEFEFFLWLLIASGEWVGCFIFLAYFDFWETPAADLRQKTTGYLELMRTEQRARLKAIYGWEE